MATDIFMKIGDIKGESADKTHPGEIELLSFSWGETNVGSRSATGGAGAGKVSFMDFNFTTKVSKALPKLMLACASGQDIPNESLSMVFTKVDFEYKEQKADGSVGSSTKFAWDLKKNQKA